MKRDRVLGFLLLILLAISTGCGGSQPKANKDSQPNAENQSDRQAADLWSQVLEKYRSLGSYQDSAEIQIQYELSGKRSIEVQPCSVSFDRNSAFWMTHFFRTTTWSEDGKFFQKINEPATSNLDDQILTGQGGDWTKIFADPVSKVYLSGQTDFPTNPISQGGNWPPLFSPQLALLQNQSLSEKPFYTQPNSTVSFAGSARIGDIFCKVLSVENGKQKALFWVDQENLWIHKVQFSNDLLLKELVQTPEVQNIQLTISVGELTSSLPKRPDLKILPKHGKGVRNFVRIPEKLPSPWIGRPSPPITSLTIDGQPWQLSNYHGRTVLAVFPAAGNAEQIQSFATTLQNLATSSSFSQAEFVLAPFSIPKSLSSVDTQGVSILKNGIAIREELRIPIHSSVVIWDGHGTVQYAGVLSTDKSIKDQLLGLLGKLARGQSIAAEMKNEYQKYYREYLSEIEAVKTGPLPSKYFRTNIVAKPTGTQGNEQSLDQVRSALTVSVPSPNAVRYVESSAIPNDEIWVLSGFRTIVGFDLNGKKVRNIPLQFPDQMAARQFRIATVNNQLSIFTLDPGANYVYRFDLNGKYIEKLGVNPKGQISDFRISNNHWHWWLDNKNKTVHRMDLLKRQLVGKWTVPTTVGNLQNGLQIGRVPNLFIASLGTAQGETLGLQEDGGMRTLSTPVISVGSLSPTSTGKQWIPIEKRPRNALRNLGLV